MPSHSGKLACWLASFLGVFVTGQIPIQPDLMPEFLAPLENHTVPQGRDVHFTCVVNHLGDYRVAWIKSDSKGILAIHTNMIALNPRLSVTYNGHNTWRLHVSNVQANDSGTYMCQINTDPMRSQMGALIVVIPPDIAAESATGAAREGGSVRLRCAATGEPPPAVAWRRDAARPIVFRQDGGREKQAVTTYSGEVLHLPHVLRSDMGSYYCIASNGVPPAVSRRYSVEVHFYPLIKVSNQLVAAPIGSDVVLECYVEASPKAMNSWYRENGDKLLDNSKYTSSESALGEYALYMNLTVRALERRDYGGYVCASANALGRAEGSVRLQELQLSGTATPRQHRKPAEQRSKARRKPEPRDASTHSWLDAPDPAAPRSLDAAPHTSPGTLLWWCGFSYVVSRLIHPAAW